MGIKEALEEIAARDVRALIKAEKSYGNSWKKRGGMGAFMMLARKWDRIDNQVRKFQFDIFNTIYEDPSPQGILDDIGDLRRYLFLVEAEVRAKLGGYSLDPPEGEAQESFKFLEGNTLETTNGPPSNGCEGDINQSSPLLRVIPPGK
jgi:hypothetical protein